MLIVFPGKVWKAGSRSNKENVCGRFVTVLSTLVKGQLVEGGWQNIGRRRYSLPSNKQSVYSQNGVHIL